MDKVRRFLHRVFRWVWPTECQQERPHRDSCLGSSFSSGGTFSLMGRNAPGRHASVCGIRRVAGPRGVSAEKAVSLGQAQLGLLGSTRVDVLPIHGVFHEGNVVIGGQGEMRNTAHEASHVLPISVQSDFLHSTCQEARGRRAEPEGSRSR